VDVTNDEWAAKHQHLMENIHYALKAMTNLSEKDRNYFKRLMVIYMREEFGDE